MTRQRDTVITYAVRGAIDDTSRPNLVRITHEDAMRIMPMADPRPDGDLRSAYEAAQPLLQALVEEPLQNLPLRLQTEQELHTLLSQDGQRQRQRDEVSGELARRAALTPAQHNAENRIQQQLYAARSPLTAEAASRREAGTVIDDPDIQASIDMVAISHPKPTASIPRPPTPAKPTTEGPLQAEPDPAAGLD